MSVDPVLIAVVRPWPVCNHSEQHHWPSARRQFVAAGAFSAGSDVVRRVSTAVAISIWADSGRHRLQELEIDSPDPMRVRIRRARAVGGNCPYTDLRTHPNVSTLA